MNFPQGRGPVPRVPPFHFMDPNALQFPGLPQDRLVFGSSGAQQINEHINHTAEPIQLFEKRFSSFLDANKENPKIIKAAIKQCFISYFMEEDRGAEDYGKATSCSVIVTPGWAGYFCSTCSKIPNTKAVFCGHCFSKERHKGHRWELAYKLTALCDCGDPETAEPGAFCPRHTQQTDILAKKLGIDSETVYPKSNVILTAVIQFCMQQIITYSCKEALASKYLYSIMKVLSKCAQRSESVLSQDFLAKALLRQYSHSVPALSCEGIGSKGMTVITEKKSTSGEKRYIVIAA